MLARAGGHSSSRSLCFSVCVAHARGEFAGVVLHDWFLGRARQVWGGPLYRRVGTAERDVCVWLCACVGVRSAGGAVVRVSGPPRCAMRACTPPAAAGPGARQGKAGTGGW